MTVRVRLPELGESVDGGILVSWLVAVGDVIEAGQSVAEISTDKVDTEIPSDRAGTVVALLVDVDAEVAVGADLLELEETSAQAPGAPASTGAPETPVEPVVSIEPEAPVEATAAPVEAAPAASDARATAGLRLSPLAKRLARQHAVDPSELAGTGRGGRITREDVQAAVERRSSSGATTQPRRTPLPALAPALAGAASGSTTEALSRTRKVIAQRMHESIHNSAQLTAAVEADMTRVMRLRSRVRDAAKAQHGVSLSPLAFIAHATIRALAAHPLLNASIDVEAGTFTTYAGVGLGIAVDAPAGLIVPVIKDAQLLSPIGIQQRIADLAERARSKRIGPDDLTGGTFTITNTGSRGSLFDTPILNAPEVGILATPAIEKRPVVITEADGTDRIAIRHRTYLCLTYDHRLVDGADAARFLSDLAQLVDSDDWGPDVAALDAATARQRTDQVAAGPRPTTT